MGVNHRVQQDVQRSEQYQTATATGGATTAAAQRLAENLQNMPERYFTKGNETAGQLQALIEAQTKLHETTNDKSGSVTQQTLSSSGHRWAGVPTNCRRGGLGCLPAVCL